MSRTKTRNKRKTAAHRHQHHRHGERRPKPARQPISDRVVYLLAVLIGFFSVIIAGLLTADAARNYWPYFTLFYLALLLYGINTAGWRIYAAKHIPDWQQSLAKLPLTLAGYGSRSGKALEAAHGQAAVRKTLILFGIGSVIVFAAVTLLLMRWM